MQRLIVNATARAHLFQMESHLANCLERGATDATGPRGCIGGIPASILNAAWVEEALSLGTKTCDSIESHLSDGRVSAERDCLVFRL